MTTTAKLHITRIEVNIVGSVCPAVFCKIAGGANHSYYCDVSTTDQQNSNGNYKWIPNFALKIKNPGRDQLKLEVHTINGAIIGKGYLSLRKLRNIQQEEVYFCLRRGSDEVGFTTLSVALVKNKPSPSYTWVPTEDQESSETQNTVSRKRSYGKKPATPDIEIFKGIRKQKRLSASCSPKVQRPNTMLQTPSGGNKLDSTIYIRLPERPKGKQLVKKQTSVSYQNLTPQYMALPSPHQRSFSQ